MKGNNLIRKLRTLADGKTPIRLLDEFNYAALDVIASVRDHNWIIKNWFKPWNQFRLQVAFGMDIDSINGSDIRLNQEITEAMKIFNFAFIDPFAKVDKSSV